MQYQQLNQMPDVLNEKPLSIPVYDIKLSPPEQFHPIIGKSITDSSALLNIFNQLENIESGNVCWTIFLNTSSKIIGFIGSDNKEFPFSDDNEKVRYFTSISQTLCRGVAVLVKNPSYDFDDNDMLSKINKLKEDLSNFSIVLLDFAIKGEGYGFVSIAETGKFEMGGSVFKKYPSLDNLKPDVLNEPYSIKDLKHIEIIKKEHFTHSNNVIKKSSDAQQILFDFWDKTKINLVEQMYVLFLNSKLKPIGLYHHTTGGVSGTILDNVIIVAIATKIGAKKVVIAHNHPSGRVFPSDSDIKISKRLKKSLEIVKIELLDSIILSPKPEDMYSLFEYGNLYENGGQLSSKERDKEIAGTILKQLGGAYRLMSFTGANNFIAEKNGVSFRIKNKKVNYVKITLNSMDTYDIIFGRIYGANFSIVKELNGIYNDQLIEVFERNTGMYLRFKRGGAIQGEENAEMVMNQNLQIRHHTEELEEILKSGKDVPAWVVSKISRAADSMSDATHYLEGTPSKMEDGGQVAMDLESLLKKSPIEVYNSPYHIEIEIKYNKGGMNYFRGVNESRGFYLHVTPVKISSVKENIYTKQYAAFSGYKQLVLIVNRFSEKMENQAIQHAKDYYQMMIEKVLHKIREEYPEASLTKVIEAPAPFPENEEVENEPNLPLNPPIDMPKGNQQDEADRLDEIFKLTQEIQSLESIVEYFEGEDLEYLQIQIEILQDNVELLERIMDVSIEEKEEVEAGAFTQSQSQIAQNNINQSKTNSKKYSVLFTKEFNPNKVMRTSVSEIEADSKEEAEIKIKKTYPKSKILSISIKGKENKFARGGRLRNRTIVVLDEGYGQIINDLYTEWNNITNQKEQEAWEARVNKIKFGTYGTVSIFDVLKNFEFDRSRGGNSIMKTDFKNELRYAISKGQNNRLSQGGNVFVCPVGTEVQSLIFDKDFFSVDQSKNWAKKHGFQYAYVDEKINTFRIRQQEPSFFQKEGFRTIQFTEGVQAVIGCPKKKIKKNASKSKN